MGNRSVKDSVVKAPIHPFTSRYEELYERLCSAEGLSPAHENVNVAKVLNEDLFKQHFRSPDKAITENFFNQFFVDLVSPAVEAKELFVERCTHVTSVVGGIPNVEQIQFLFNLLSDNASQLSIIDLKKVIHGFNVFALHQIALDSDGCVPETCHPFDPNDLVLTSIANSILEKRSSVTCQEAADWIYCNCPKMTNGVETWLEFKFTGVPKTLSGFIPQPFECIGDTKLLLSPSCLWYLCCMLPACYTYMENKYRTNTDEEDTTDAGDTAFTWNLLFDSNQHGLSLNRFKHKVMGYKSPTLMLIEFSSGLLVALALDEKWTDSPEKYGGPYTQLIELSPRVDVIEAGSRMVYLKEMGRAVPTGLLLGADTKPKIKLDKDLSSGEVNYREEGNAQVDRMEVWGCGGVAAMNAQRDMKKWEQKEVEKRKKVKLPGQWDADKTILEMGGVCVDHSQRGDV